MTRTHLEELAKRLAWLDTNAPNYSAPLMSSWINNVRPELQKAAAAIRELQAKLPCGHPSACMEVSAETGEPLYCGWCNAVSYQRDLTSDAEAKLAELLAQKPVAWLVPQAKAGEKPTVFNDKNEARAFCNSQHGMTYPQPLIVAPGYPYRAAHVPAVDPAELVAALQGMLAIEDSVTQGQEKELRDKWIPAARAALQSHLDKLGGK